ncbi:hypothetical protein AAMO2058_000330800 [Amorphochlora amoebiformis]|mmetsp:Transcript_19524/g.31002  ORF Transcript_19524/g.31002 Transcript_19524/m.31002 type:complete len:231 (-) Transcript_19524:86-778(-)
MQTIRQAFNGANILHYIGLGIMSCAVILAASSIGSAWIKAKKGDCTFYLYARTFTVDDCSLSQVMQYYECNDSYCSKCRTAGEVLLVMGVFGMIVGSIEILLTLKRVFNDTPQDWAGKNMRKVTSFVCLLCSVLWLISWIAFLGGCESALGDFDSSSPHTGFVLMFFAMILAGVVFLCDVLAPNKRPPSAESASSERPMGNLAEKEVTGNDEGVIEDGLDEKQDDMHEEI